jgi:hypothetical protein
MSKRRRGRDSLYTLAASQQSIAWLMLHFISAPEIDETCSSVASFFEIAHHIHLVAFGNRVGLLSKSCIPYFGRQPETATHSENNLSIFRVELLQDRKRHVSLRLLLWRIVKRWIV